MYYYETVTEAVAGLAKRGYNANFNLSKEYIACEEMGLKLSAEEFHIEETYRFEGQTDPGDEMVVYGISSDKGIKGILVNAYGPYADEASARIIEKLKESH
ncbi:MAG: phosphoribosylpyrophosphate synthetase [Bacteroidetes bacterium]|nr:phosphoribosylpyrophosphate synthetase [Bacteroidota bacterium]